MQLAWKLAQIGVFVGFVVLFYEGNDRQTPMLACIVIAFALTAVMFAPLLHLSTWLRRRKLTRSHDRFD